MIISESMHSWQVLIDKNIIKPEECEFIFGSSFQQDKLNPTTYYAYLNKVINCMQVGRTVVQTY